MKTLMLEIHQSINIIAKLYFGEIVKSIKDFLKNVKKED